MIVSFIIFGHLDPKTVSEFAQELSGAMESHGANVRRLVDEFRSKSAETRGEGGGMRRVWENLLRQVEADAAAHVDLAGVLQQQLSRPTIDASFHRKLQSRKVNFDKISVAKGKFRHLQTMAVISIRHLKIFRKKYRIARFDKNSQYLIEVSFYPCYNLPAILVQAIG